MQKRLAIITAFSVFMSMEFSSGCELNLELYRYLNRANRGASILEDT